MLHSLDRDLTPGRVGRAVNGGFDWLRDRVVVPFAGLALRFRYLTLGIAAFLVMLSIAPFTGGLIKFQSFPTLESDTVEARLLLVQGSPLARTEQRVAKVVAALEKMNAELSPAQPGGQTLVQSITISYGINADSPEIGPHMATVSAKLLPAGTRTTSVTDILDKLEAAHRPAARHGGLPHHRQGARRRRQADRRAPAGARPEGAGGDGQGNAQVLPRLCRRARRHLRPAARQAGVPDHRQAVGGDGARRHRAVDRHPAARRLPRRHRAPGARRSRRSRHHRPADRRGPPVGRRPGGDQHHRPRRRAGSAFGGGRYQREPRLCLGAADRRPAHGFRAGLDQSRGRQFARADGGAQERFPARSCATSGRT